MTDIMFRDKPSLLVKHQLQSYNAFINGGIQRVFREKNPISILKEQDLDTGVFANKCELFLGGEDGSKVYFGRPVVADPSGSKILFPNIARIRDMSYSATVHVDVIAVFTIGGNEPERVVLPKILLGRFPIMLMSDLCVLNGLTSSVRHELGECQDEKGGYFIVDGSEKVIVSQEKFADNMLYVRAMSGDKYDFAADVRSVSTNASKPTRVTSVRLVAPSSATRQGSTTVKTNGQIVVIIANVRAPMPLFIVMRALGVLSDKAIIESCLLDLEEYKSYVDLFRPSVHDAGPIFTQANALKYIASFTKHKTIPYAMEILADYFLPHVGEVNFKLKSLYLGHMVKELLRVRTGDDKPTDRDSFLYKRVELPGELLTGLFKEYLTLQYKSIYQRIDKEYTYKTQLYRSNFKSLIDKNTSMIFSERIVEEGFRKAFKGNWGASANTKRMGLIQTLNRLSFNSAISHLRKLNLSYDSGAKITGPRLLQGSQWGVIDPIDTPDGGNVGLHKHMAIATEVSVFCDARAIEAWGFRNGLESPEARTYSFLANSTKVIVNGNWSAVTLEPVAFCEKFRLARRCGLIPSLVSISWYISPNIIYIFTDGGRLCRPVYWLNRSANDDFISKSKLERVHKTDISWNELLTGRSAEGPKACNYDSALAGYKTENLSELAGKCGIIDMLDTNEEENALIAFDETGIGPRTTHVEIDPSFLLGVMGNQVVFPENNPLPRDLFACGQMRQAVSVYHSNYQERIDKMGVVLNDGQIPLTKSRYLRHISNNKHPYGVNVICAIMCYGGYNVEDSILFNQGSLDRGLFRTTYYNSYSTHEEMGTGKKGEQSRIGKVSGSDVVGLKQGYDYTALGDNGLVEEGTKLTDKVVLIGKRTLAGDDENDIDASVFTKKAQKGFVDKVFITEGEEGQRIAKVRVRDERKPAIGDKFCSRCGQKGTIGQIIPEEDMPYTANGLKPDIIINPHALPSRMTIGQLVETLMGKACLELGGFADCTAFANKGQKATKFGEVLSELGYTSTGNELLYNGESGLALETSIFIGPTYYMRLKHMVKDKINYRAKGPRTLLTRQTVQGRANEGGLRVGEMERDTIAAHGIMHFLQESMLVRGDEYYMAVCNKTGTIAVYNEALDLFLSPSADGPIKFEGTVDEGLNVVNVSRHGRSFSILRIPYSFKLLMQELSTMNVQMRLITDQNVSYLDSVARQKIKLASVVKTEMSEIKDITTEIEEQAANEVGAPLGDIVSNLESGLQTAVSGVESTVSQITEAVTAATQGQPETEGQPATDGQEAEATAADNLQEAEATAVDNLQEAVQEVEKGATKLDNTLASTPKTQETGLQDLAEGFTSLGKTLGLVDTDDTKASEKKIVSVRNEDLIGKN